MIPKSCRLFGPRSRAQNQTEPSDERFKLNASRSGAAALPRNRSSVRSSSPEGRGGRRGPAWDGNGGITHRTARHRPRIRRPQLEARAPPHPAGGAQEVPPLPRTCLPAMCTPRSAEPARTGAEQPWDAGPCERRYPVAFPLRRQWRVSSQPGRQYPGDIGHFVTLAGRLRRPSRDRGTAGRCPARRRPASRQCPGPIASNRPSPAWPPLPLQRRAPPCLPRLLI